MDTLFNLLGLGIPFSLGAATYGFFWWLDNNIADEHSQVISSWLHGRSQNKPDLGNLIIKAFDRLYTSPLLRFRAFRRSAAISMIIWLVVYFIPWALRLIFLPSESGFYITIKSSPLTNLLIEVLLTLPLIIISDYVSLPFVRKLLSLARSHPLRATIGAFILGALIIMAFIFLFAVAIVALVFISVSDFYVNLATLGFIISGGNFLGILTPALTIHLWLPLFALSSLVVKLVFWIFKAVEWAQWFLKQGDAHPLKAIGIVATIIVFGSAMLVKEGWALLSVLERS